jgi:hypothetical protein
MSIDLSEAQVMALPVGEPSPRRTVTPEQVRAARKIATSERFQRESSAYQEEALLTALDLWVQS